MLPACGDSGSADSSDATSDGSSGTGSGTGSGTDGGDTVAEPTGPDPTGETPTSTSEPAPPGCGDGKLDPGEQCDDGEANGEPGACSAECTQPAACTDAPISLLSRTPAGQAGVLAADAAIALEFACSVDRASVDDTTIAVFGSQSGRRGFTVEWSEDATAELVLAAPLLPGERIDVTLTAGIRDGDGGTLTPQVFHFTVAGAAGSGSFAAVDASVGNNSYAALGDLDGDGDLDVVRASGDVHRNDGDAGFALVEYDFSCSQAASTSQVVLADLDSDRDLDLLCRGSSGVGSMWRNDGAGGFSEAPAQELLNGRDRFVVGDVDGDGDLDAFAGTGSTDSADTILLNDGTGVFTVGAEAIGSVSSGSVALGDLDGDGDLDLAFGHGNSEQATYWTNDGAGGFTASGAALGTGPHPQNGLDIGDVDRDGAADLVVMPLFSTGAWIWTNDGAGGFADGLDLATDHAEDALLRDIDGDGDLDVVSVHHNFFVKANQVWLGAGDGGFTPGLPFGGGGDGLALGDVDGDGRIDAIVDSTLYLGQ